MRFSHDSLLVFAQDGEVNGDLDSEDDEDEEDEDEDEGQEG